MLKKKKYAKWANGDEGPDWGDLKHNEKEQEIALKKVKEVGTHYFGMLQGGPYITANLVCIFLSEHETCA